MLGVYNKSKASHSESPYRCLVHGHANDPAMHINPQQMF